MTDAQKTQIVSFRAMGCGYGAIAKELKIPINTVKSFCRRNNTAAGKSTVVLSGEITHCDNCGKTIQQIAKQKPKRFCCDKCRNTWWNNHLNQVKRKKNYRFICPHCGKEFLVYGDNRRKYCCHECYIADRFRGGDCNE